MNRYTLILTFLLSLVSFPSLGEIYACKVDRDGETISLKYSRSDSLFVGGVYSPYQITHEEKEFLILSHSFVDANNQPFSISIIINKESGEYIRSVTKISSTMDKSSFYNKGICSIQ